MAGSLFDAILKLTGSTTRRDSTSVTMEDCDVVEWRRPLDSEQQVLGEDSVRINGSAPRSNFETIDDLSQEQIEEFREAFALFDKDGDGTITGKELSLVLRGLGQNPTDEEINAMIAEVDSDGSGSIEFSEFLQLIANRLRTEDVDEELKDAFRVFDKNRDGLLSAAELREALAGLGEEMSPQDIEELIRAADINNDGQIDYAEFASMMLQE